MTTDTGNLLVQYSLQLLQQDMLTNSLFMGGEVGKSLRDIMLKETSVARKTDPSAKALTGTIRADAGMLRQGSKNVGEGKSMMDTAASAVTSIKSALTEMKSVADKVAAGTLTAAAGQTLYDSLRSQISGIVSSTSYNGIKLLDGTNWSGDERITTTGATPTAGSVKIQAGTNTFDLTLVNVNTNDYATQAGAAALADAATAATTSTTLSQRITSFGAIADLYTSRATSLDGHATALSNQAEILATAATNQEKTNTSKTTEELLLDVLLRNTGSVVDTSG